MLTTNKAVYGTDGSLTELGKFKGGGSEPETLSGEDTMVEDDGITDSLNNYVFNKVYDTLTRTSYFNKRITDNTAEKLGGSLTNILNVGSKSPVIILNLIDTNTGAFDIKTILFETFSYLFKHDTTFQEYISFGLPDSDGIINNVKLYSGGKIDNEYTVIFHCENGDISNSLVLQIYAL